MLLYGGTDVGEAAALGNGLTYTGVLTGAAFEDQLFQTVTRTGYLVQGHPAVVSDVQGGNATLAWEPTPGAVAYVGYSGSTLSSDAVAALYALAARAAPLSQGEWEATGPQVDEQVNGPTTDQVTNVPTNVGCGTTPDRPATASPDWAQTNGAPNGLGLVQSQTGKVDRAHVNLPRVARRTWGSSVFVKRQIFRVADLFAVVVRR